LLLSGVRPFPNTVIPAQAGIHRPSLVSTLRDCLDPRLRGDDGQESAWSGGENRN